MKRSLRKFLGRRGASGAEIENAEQNGYLALLVLDRAVMPGARRYTSAELAQRAGTDLATAKKVWRAIGFPDLPDTLPAFTDDDVNTLKSFLRTFTQAWVLDWNIDRALPQARVVSASLARIADTVTDEIARSFRDAAASGMSDEDIAELVAERINISDIAELLVHVYRLQLRAAVWRRLANTAREVPGTVTLAVGFVDLVGYTALSQMLDDDELARLVQRFGDVTHDTVTASGGRIVKTIGDAVMFITDTARAAAEIALRLTEQTAGDELLPQTRAGLSYGGVLSREGDYFGPVVNLASRLTEIARPGSALISTEFADALGTTSEFHLKRIPSRRIRDIGKVEVFSLERS